MTPDAAPLAPDATAEVNTPFAYLPALEQAHAELAPWPPALGEPTPSWPPPVSVPPPQSIPPPAARTITRERVLSAGDLVAYWALTLLWVAVNWRFWSWWLEPDHRGSIGMFAVATVLLAYLTTGLPCFFWYYVLRMRRPQPLAAAPGRRVAMITLCVPSHESRDIIAAQLAALQRVRYPHDSWLLDEGGRPELRALAETHGVRYFTRHGVAEYNEADAPFQARTKAGNVNAWLDHIEREGIAYDVFVQLDIDHHPQPDYLDRILGYFDDPDVAWVQSPSVCRNLRSWTARGLAEQEVVLQGPLQMGFYGHSQTPFIIGSHTAYRTSAVYAINGFQPTRAEDHLDTVVLAAAGYCGVYLPQIIAAGDGPEDLGTYLRQQYAWAYSMAQIFIRHTPRLLFHYRASQAIQFLVAQSWYFLWSLALAVLWVLPIVALLSGEPIAHVGLGEFLVFHWTVTLTSLLMWWWTRRWFQPAGIGLTWRGVLLEIARWPVVLIAVVTAALGIPRTYMITPKGRDRATQMRGLYTPYLVLTGVALTAVAASLAQPAGPTRPYVILVLLNALTFIVMIACALALEGRDARWSRREGPSVMRGRAATVYSLLLLVALAAATAAASWEPVMASIR